MSSALKQVVNTLRSLDIKKGLGYLKYLDPMRPSYKWLEKEEDGPKLFFYQVGVIILLIVGPMKINKWRKNRAEEKAKKLQAQHDDE
jgi:hypothetical protein